MKKLQMILAVLSVGAFCAMSFAQDAAPSAAPAKKPQPVVKQIPAGAMGFVVINDIKAFTDSLDKFLVDIGLGPVAKEEMPEGSLKELMIKMSTGDGFNPAGGFALVMLDPTTVGMDLMDVLPEAVGGKGGDFTEWGPPFVAFIPGESFAKVFPKATKPETRRGEKYDTVDIGFGPLVAAQMGDYVLLSPQEKAVDAVINAPKKLSDEMSKAEYDTITRNQVALSLNMRVVGPLLEKVFKHIDDQAKTNASGGGIGPDETMMLTMIQFCRPYLAQFQSLSLAARIDASAVVVDGAMDFTADGEIGKALASFKGASKPSLDKVPNLGYVLALGAVVVDQKLAAKWDATSIDLIVKMMAAQGKAIPDDLKDKLLKVCTACDEQITGCQLVFGQAPKGAGLFGMSMAIDCKDAAKLQAAMADLAGVINDLIKAVGGEDAKDIKVTYAPAAETVGDAKVDVMEITSPKMADTDSKKEDMTKIIGEARVRFFIAPAGANTLVMTFGGGKAFLEEAIKTASGSTGTIAKEIPADAAKVMPANSTMTLTFSAANLVDFIMKAQAVDTGEKPDETKMPKLDKTPLVLGGGCQGSTCLLSIFAPTAVIKDLVSFFMRISEPMVPSPADPPPAQVNPPAPPAPK